jgi:hypothetical protein
MLYGLLFRIVLRAERKLRRKEAPAEDVLCCQGYFDDACGAAARES